MNVVSMHESSENVLCQIVLLASILEKTFELPSLPSVKSADGRVVLLF